MMGEESLSPSTQTPCTLGSLCKPLPFLWRLEGPLRNEGCERRRVGGVCHGDPDRRL